MSTRDVIKEKVPVVSLLTPPLTQKTSALEASDPDDEQSPIVHGPILSNDNNLFPPLPKSPIEAPVLTEINIDDFDYLVEVLDTADDNITPEIKAGNCQIVDVVHLAREQEIVPFQQVSNRVYSYRKLQIPHTDPTRASGWSTRRYRSAALTGLPTWFYARRLAYQGMLHDVPANIESQYIRNKWEIESCKAPKLRPNPPSAARSATTPKKPTPKKSAPKARATRRAEECEPTPDDSHHQTSSAISSSDSAASRPGHPATRGKSQRQRKLSPKAAEAATAEAKFDGKWTSPGARVSRLEANQSTEVSNDSNETQIEDTQPSALDVLATVATTPGVELPRAIIKLNMKTATAITDSAPTTSPTTVASTSVNRKRKRAVAVVDDADEEASQPAKKETKRAAFDFNDTTEGPPGRFAQAVKHLLNERSADNSDFKSFNDGLSLCPAGTEDTQTKETSFAKELNLTPEQYKVVKFRFFLAAAMLTEVNLRIEQHKAAGNTIKTNLLNFNKTQVQLWNNIDVNKGSKVYIKFKEFGWIPEMLLQQGKKTKVVNPVYKTLYPAETRKALLDKLMAFEARTYTDVTKRVVLSSLV